MKPSWNRNTHFKVLGYQFKNIFLLHEALTWAYDSSLGHLEKSQILYTKKTNFRLKTLGKSVLKLVSSLLAIMEAGDNISNDEGSLTQYSQSLVTNDVLKVIGGKLQLENEVEITNVQKRDPGFNVQNCFSSVLQAIFGAVFVDSGGSFEDGNNQALYLFIRLWTKYCRDTLFKNKPFKPREFVEYFPPPRENVHQTLRQYRNEPVQLAQLQDSLQYDFNKLYLLEEALTHDSINQYKELANAPNYQRLEFLGDAIFEVVISEYLFWHYVSDEKGLEYNSLSIVSYTDKVFQAAVAGDLDLETYVRKPQHVRVYKIEAFLESVVAAIYVDCGGNLSQVSDILVPLCWRPVECIVGRRDLRLPFSMKTYYGSGYHYNPVYEDNGEMPDPPVKQASVFISLKIFLENWEDIAPTEDEHNKRFKEAVNYERHNKFTKIRCPEYVCNRIEFHRMSVYRLAACIYLKFDFESIGRPECSFSTQEAALIGRQKSELENEDFVQAGALWQASASGSKPRRGNYFKDKMLNLLGQTLELILTLLLAAIMFYGIQFFLNNGK